MQAHKREWSASRGSDRGFGFTDYIGKREYIAAAQSSQHTPNAGLKPVNENIHHQLGALKCEVEDALRDPEAIAQASTFERVLQEINRLNRICDSLLFLAGADSGTIRLDFSRIDLSLLCQEIVEDIRTIAEPKSIAVTADVQSPVFLNCDVHLIRRLLLNLLDNALKYNHADGWIRLQIGLKAGLAVIAVANSGPEIPAEHRGHLFEPFYRVDNSRSRRTGGIGLGLSICREIVALHQGTFKLRKSTGEETVFEVFLPTI